MFFLRVLAHGPYSRVHVKCSVGVEHDSRVVDQWSRRVERQSASVRTSMTAGWNRVLGQSKEQSGRSILMEEGNGFEHGSKANQSQAYWHGQWRCLDATRLLGLNSAMGWSGVLGGLSRVAGKGGITGW